MEAGPGPTALWPLPWTPSRRRAGQRMWEGPGKRAEGRLGVAGVRVWAGGGGLLRVGLSLSSCRVCKVFVSRGSDMYSF